MLVAGERGGRGLVGKSYWDIASPLVGCNIMEIWDTFYDDGIDSEVIPRESRPGLLLEKGLNAKGI